MDFSIGNWVELKENPEPVKSNNWLPWVKPFVGKILVITNISENAATLETLSGESVGEIDWFAFCDLKHVDPRNIVKVRKQRESF